MEMINLMDLCLFLLTRGISHIPSCHITAALRGERKILCSFLEFAGRSHLTLSMQRILMSKAQELINL